MSTRKKAKTTVPIDTSRLLAIMEKQGVSRYQLWKATGIPRQTVYQIFRDEQASAQNIERIAQLLDISPLAFLDTKPDLSEIVSGQTFKEYQEMKGYRPTEKQKDFIRATTALNAFMNALTFISETGEEMKVPENMFVSDMEFYNYMVMHAWRYIQEKEYERKLKKRYGNY